LGNHLTTRKNLDIHKNAIFRFEFEIL